MLLNCLCLRSSKTMTVCKQLVPLCTSWLVPRSTSSIEKQPRLGTLRIRPFVSIAVHIALDIVATSWTYLLRLTLSVQAHSVLLVVWLLALRSAAQLAKLFRTRTFLTLVLASMTLLLFPLEPLFRYVLFPFDFEKKRFEDFNLYPLRFSLFFCCFIVVLWKASVEMFSKKLELSAEFMQKVITTSYFGLCTFWLENAKFSNREFESSRSKKVSFLLGRLKAKFRLK